MHSILSCLLCLSLISPIYVQKYVPGLYQVKSAQKVYLKPSVSSYGDKILWEVPFNCDHEVVFF